MVKVSIILPIYNVERYLPKCLDSLTAQTLEDIEIICVNDGSTDNTLQILQQYAAKDKRIKIINQANAGPGVARNNGIAAAKGEYIAFVDPDDWVEIEAYEELYQIIKKENADMAEFAFAVHEEKDGKVKIKDKLYKDLIVDVKKYPQFLFGNDIAVWNKLFNAEFIRKNKISFSAGYCAEDMIFTVSTRATAAKIIYIDKVYYHYLHRKSSITHKKSAVNLTVPNFVADTKQFLLQHNCYENYADNFWEPALRILAIHYRKLPDECIDEYNRRCKAIMTDELYSRYTNYTKELSLLQKLFSVRYNGKVYEVRLLGLKIKIKL